MWAGTVKIQSPFWDSDCQTQAPPGFTASLLGKNVPGGALLGNDPGVQRPHTFSAMCGRNRKASARTRQRGRAQHIHAERFQMLHVILTKGGLISPFYLFIYLL